MKLKIIFIIELILIIISNISVAQFPCAIPDSIYRTNVPTDTYHNSELMIYNQTKYWLNQYGISGGTAIKIHIIPTGFLCNGAFHYTQKAENQIISSKLTISGYDTILPIQSTWQSKSFTSGNFDKGAGGNCNFSFGFGKYKIEFYLLDDETPPYPGWKLVNFVYVDFRDASDYHLPYEYNDTYDCNASSGNGISKFLYL